MLHNMKGQFAEHLMSAGFVSSRDPKDAKSNINSGNYRSFLLIIIQTILLSKRWGLFGFCFNTLSEM